MLTHSNARSIAEALWGTGGTHSEPTNRHGAFYFSCSGHGGFVVDTRALTDEELARLKQFYGEPEKGTAYGSKIMHPYRTRKLTYKLTDKIEPFEFYLFEEDCNWAVLYELTGIKHKEKPASDESVKKTLKSYFPEIPVS